MAALIEKQRDKHQRGNRHLVKVKGWVGHFSNDYISSHDLMIVVPYCIFGISGG